MKPEKYFQKQYSNTVYAYIISSLRVNVILVPAVQYSPCGHAAIEAVWLVMEDRMGNPTRLYHLLPASRTIKSSDGICVSIKPYLKIFCLFKNSLNSPNALSDCSVITLGRAEMAELESYLLPSFPLRADWKPCSGALARSPVKTAF